MGKYEVTQGQWQAVMGSNPATAYGVGVDHPVHTVSWNDIHGFLGRANDGFRLPSEAEWEYAARAGSEARFYWGDDPDYRQIDLYAVHADNDPNGTAQVGTKQPNAWGLYDMSGNVWEWIEDDYHDSYGGAPSESTAWTDNPRGSYRVLRGGSWNFDPSNCRSAARNWYDQVYSSNLSGFRVVLVP